MEESIRLYGIVIDTRSRCKRTLSDAAWSAANPESSHVMEHNQNNETQQTIHFLM